MNQGHHSALIYVGLDLVGGQELARQLLGKMREAGEVTSISSIYKRFLTEDRAELRSRMEFVLRLDTKMSVDQTLHMVLSLCAAESGAPKKGHCEMILLVYDRKILMSPKLTLPYPQLHTDPLIIRCSAEAWGSYEHPIYQKSLSEIAREAVPAQYAEFYLQGKSLIDF